MGAQILQARDYTVAWVSALYKEYLVACTVLDEQHETPKDLDGDTNCYTFGSIGCHNVVIACLDRMGEVHAAMKAASLLTSFPNLRFGLLVGIAGGAPTCENDVRLGDVVVGYPSGKNGGAIYYDSGVVNQATGFQHRGNLIPPPQILLNATIKLRTQQAQNGCRLHELVHDLINRKSPVLDVYRKPPDSTDILYKSTHQHPASRTCEEACRLMASEIVGRNERLVDKRHAVWYGAVGTADKLLRDAIIRDRLAEQHGLLCFEMESAGLLASDLRCMVIRGISDYADSHKNDKWQEYAAAMAAIYAKEMLKVVKPQKINIDTRSTTINRFASKRGGRPGTKSATRSATRSATSYAPTLNRANSDVLTVLKFENMDDKKVRSSPRGNFDHSWIWSTEFPEWLSSSEQLYWISGKPGSGKSTLVAYLIADKHTLVELEFSGTRFKVLHFYFDYRAGTALANNVLGMFRMFLLQLAQQVDEARTHLQTCWQTGRLQLDSQDHLLDVTCSSIDACSQNVCIFVDGIDEYEGNILDIIHLIQSLLQRTSIKVCLASRPDDRIQASLGEDPRIIMEDLNEDSMLSYVQQKIKESSAVDLSVAKRFSDDLIDSLIWKAQGIFLWFKLAVDEVMEHLNQGYSEEQAQELIEKMPVRLDDVYRRMLMQIPQKQRPEAALILFLTDELQNLSSWTEEGLGSDVEFTTTNLDHLWGAYDFVVDQLDDSVSIQRLADCNELMIRVRQLLRGLIGFAVATKQESSRTDFCGITKINVRYIHETFAAYLSTDECRDWIDAHLPLTFRRDYTESFWLSFTARVVEQAAKDKIIDPDVLKEGEREMNSYLKTAMFAAEGSDFSTVARILYHLVKNIAGRRSVLIAIHSEFCQATIEAQPDNDTSKRFFKHITAKAPSVAFPPVWKSRHVILRSSLVLLPHLAIEYEEEEKSSFPIINKALRSYLNSIFGYCWVRSDNAVDLGLLRALHKNPHLKEVFDLFLAVCTNLTLYFKDRLSSSSLSSAQQDFLYKTVLSHPRAAIEPSIESVQNFIATLSTYCRLPKAMDLCSYFKSMKCWRTAAAYADILPFHTQSEKEVANTNRVCCQGPSKDVSLLYHWATSTCAVECGCGAPFTKTPKHYSTVLELLLLYSQHINSPCYPGGNALQALLDISIQPATGHGPMNRYAKFIALVEHGLDPQIVTKSGTGLQAALAFQRKHNSKCSYHKYPGGYAWSVNAQNDAKDIELILKALQFYDENKTWPSRPNERHVSTSSGSVTSARNSVSNSTRHSTGASITSIDDSIKPSTSKNSASDAKDGIDVKDENGHRASWKNSEHDSEQTKDDADGSEKLPDDPPPAYEEK